jgi:hypothetical protein
MAAPLHALGVTDVFHQLETTPEGLTVDESRARLSLYGHNVLHEPPPAPLWRKFAGHTTHLMALVLWAAGVLALVGGRPLRYEPAPVVAGGYDHALHVDHPEAPSLLEQYLDPPQPRLGGQPHETAEPTTEAQG